MKSQYQYLAFMLSLPAIVSLVIGFSPINAETKVTYIANEGFMLQSGPAKVLVDALFYDDQITYCDVPSRELLDKIEKGAPPFDDIVLLLVTHWHTDHFSSSSVSRFLMNNPKW